MLNIKLVLLYFSMNIKIDQATNRHFAYTDKVSGYLELETARCTAPDRGYFRGETCLFSDFFVSTLDTQNGCFEHFDLYRSNAQYTEIKPEGFSVWFETEKNPFSLDVSVLVQDEALAFFCQQAIGLVFPQGAQFLKLRNLSDTPKWQKSFRDGFTVWHTDTGLAISCQDSFTLMVLDDERVIVQKESCAQTKTTDAPFYLVFEQGENSALTKASALVAKNALSLHCQKVSDFLAHCTLKTQNPDFDQALVWAQFNAWLLVTGKEHRGIWAGLPWFRDNWGRDTFIALPGILLASGQFAEARAVLLGFASFQCTDDQSPSWGRIPNRYRNKNDVIYNTADGTLWFIREVWEYLQYTGDTTILDTLGPVLDLAFKSDIERRIDDRGFLLHGDADTWMDARIRGDAPWSPRGDRAIDVQALWYTALKIGARIAGLQNNKEQEHKLSMLSKKVRTSFRQYFWSQERTAFADHLKPGQEGEWYRDFSVRPNQLFAISAPAILDAQDALVDSDLAHAILTNVDRELLSPFGLFSLSPEDPLFHPKHENPEWYHKDAAYHNGTIWIWNTGPYISASLRTRPEANNYTSNLSDKADALLQNIATMVTSVGTVGTLSENIHAQVSETGDPCLSGTWSQAWSLSEFARVLYQDILGFNPRLMDGRIELKPHLPALCNCMSAEVFFGHSYKLSIKYERVLSSGQRPSGLVCTLFLTTKDASLKQHLLVNGHQLTPNQGLEIFFEQAVQAPDSPVRTKNTSKKNQLWINDSFPAHNLEHEWCGSIRKKDYLEQLILSGRTKSYNGGPKAASLEWYFDSDKFKKKYLCREKLGLEYSKKQSLFRLWAPTAQEVTLLLYPDGDTSAPFLEEALLQGSLKTGDSGLWELLLPGDFHGYYYVYRVHAHGIIRETGDPFAKACGLNGKRSLICDFSKTNPDNWDSVFAPKVASVNDIVAYEVHIADITSSEHWNGPTELRRTYTGAHYSGTEFEGLPTGFDHICSLGITHVQLLPVFDFQSVDESRTQDPDYQQQVVGGLFNWGYDPQNYSSPEGSYATKPRDGLVRIKELKQLVAAFAQKGIGVIMDVVYNHVPSALTNSLEISVPGYYFRIDSYSGAGDDSASEREMFRLFMIDSLSWWLSEYKLAGFRFDLMGLHDVETINAIHDKLVLIKPDVILYGEGWDMYRANKMVPASMLQARKLPNIGFFNDALRCAIKGSVFKPADPGFIHNGSHREALKFGLVGAVYHPQVVYSHIDGTANPNPWGNRSATSVNYTEIHDNATLYDKLVLVQNEASEKELSLLQKTAIGLILFAQGMPILHAGMEFMRTKEIPHDILNSNLSLYDLYYTADKKRAFTHNSYNLSDRINALDWARCATKESLISFVRSLIAIRKQHPLFRLQEAHEIAESIQFIDFEEQVQNPQTPLLSDQNPPSPAPLIWRIQSNLTVDTWQSVCLLLNPCQKELDFTLPKPVNGGAWHLISDGDCVIDDKTPLKSTKIKLKPKALYLYADF